MGKDIKKNNQRDRIKTIAVRWVAEQFGVEKNYVYGILIGSHISGRSGEIKKAYEVKYAEIKSVLTA